MLTRHTPQAPRYSRQHKAWPQLVFDAAALAPALDQARLEQGKLLGLLGATRACVASQAVVHHAAQKAQYQLCAAQRNINPRQTKVLERLLQAGDLQIGGGFLGGMTNEKYAKITGASKATATRDLADLFAKDLLRVEGVGKATRYAVNVPGWEQPVLKP